MATDQERCEQATALLEQACELIVLSDETVDSAIMDVLADIQLAVEGIKGLGFDEDGALVAPNDPDDDYEDEDDEDDDDDADDDE